MFRHQNNIRIGALLLYMLLPLTCLFASTESYMQAMSGKIRKGDSCTVVDDKFSSFALADWNKLQNLSVDNIISFEIRKDTAFYFRKPFTCTLNLSLKLFTSREQTSPDIKKITLVVNWDSATGKSYVMLSQYKFTNAYKVVVVVDSIYSAEWNDSLPPVFRIRSQVVVERKYPFNSSFPAQISIQHSTAALDQGSSATTTDLPENDGYAQRSPSGPNADAAFGGADDGNGDHPIPPPPGATVNVSWALSFDKNYEEYDFEWTYIDKMSSIGQLITSEISAGTYSQTNVANRDLWMKNNNTRVTVTSHSYSINLPYTDGYVLFRVRGVSYQAPPGTLRLTTDWSAASEGQFFAVIDAHNPSLNWQYKGSFAEGGKRKEVISYFDATLRNRQSVTISNSEDKAIVAETIYDNMGRPSVSILPAPTNSNLFTYYPSFNLANSTTAYSRENINTVGCKVVTDPMATTSGASQYYSIANTFKDDPNYYFSKYIPDAEGYPFSVTEYTNDNTGKIRRQSGVGKDFKLGSGHETTYYYGKPAQREIDRLFGMEAGDASHYLKNMVVDPNGQISVTYIDVNGKTIATSLAGEPPATVDPLASAATATTILNQAMITPNNFTKDAGNLFMQATATFLASITGNYTLHYSVDPVSLTQTQSASGFCTTCFYNVLIEVKDDCGVVIGSAASAPFSGNDVTCNSHTTVTSDLSLNITAIGEYNITYTLKLSKDVIKQQEDYYIAHNVSLTRLKTFLAGELNQADLTGCYTECKSCTEKLGTKSQFTVTMKQTLTQLNAEKYNNAIDLSNDFASATELTNWISVTYDALAAKCASAVAACYVSPCENKLALLKRDVLPGGQYALYDPITFDILEKPISVLPHYKDANIQAKEFMGDDGSTIMRISDLHSDADFVKAYIKHPEWADDLVKSHVEYCAYTWCTTHTQVYGFEQQAKAIPTGAAAIAKSWFAASPASLYSLLDVDEFFGIAPTQNAYYIQMKNDLDNFTATANLTLKNAAGTEQPVRNIRRFIDWMLYCKPAASTGNAAADNAAQVASWNNCTVTSDCRSTGQEWEMYRNYYFQLRSKYVAIQRGLENADCGICAIGADPPPAPSNYALSVASSGCPSQGGDGKTDVLLSGLQAGDRVKVKLVMTGKIHQSAAGLSSGGARANVNIFDITNPLIQSPASEGDYLDNADHDFNVNTIMTFTVPASTYVFRTRAYVYNSKYQSLPRNAVLQLVSVNDIPVTGVQLVVCAGYELGGG
jgi:hypothetical protein